jgi:hypothetical protein
MAINKYTNIEQINSRLENEGKFLKPEDLFIVSKEESEISEFGDSKYDAMEVSVYDVNNNLLPQKSGKNVAYIKSGDIKNYIYNVVNKGGQKELAIDAEKLLNELGFSNGILKVNINFVRNRVGNDNEYQRVWLQEISATREEVRILPLKVKDQQLTKKVTEEFNRTITQDKDFKLVKKWVLDSLDSFAIDYLSKINDSMVSKFGNDFFNTIKKDFGISSFDTFKNRIFENFKLSVTYYLSNKYYDIGQTNFGRQLPTPTFDDSERYDFSMIKMEIENILYKCVSSEIKTLKRRSVEYQTLPQEFSVVQLQKSVQNNLDSFEVPTSNTKDIFSPKLAQIRREENLAVTPIPTPITNPTVSIRNLEPDIPPAPPYRPDNPIVVDPDPITLPIETPTTPIIGIRGTGGGSGGAGRSEIIGARDLIDRGSDVTQNEQ